MSVYQGAYYTRAFTINDQDGDPVDITGWTFQAQIRERVDSDEVLLELTTDDGELVILSGPDGRVEMRILAADTAALPTGRLAFDVLRTDATPGPVWLFAGRIPVKQPVTRSE